MNKRIQVLVIAAITLLLAVAACAPPAAFPRRRCRRPMPPGARMRPSAPIKPTSREWWKTFHDPLLDSLVERAVAGNLDLRIAQERVREARATRSYTAATRRLPDAGLSGGYSDRGGGGAARSFLTRDSGLYQTGFDAAYEIDIFGGARASIRAAEADAQATEEAALGTLVTRDCGNRQQLPGSAPGAGTA